jgi:ABC-2 type transport system permease protein
VSERVADPVPAGIAGAPAAATAAGGRGGAARLVRLYAGLLRAELQAASAYRAQIVLSALAWVVPLAFMALWRGASATAPVNGITQGQFTAYFALLLATTSLQVILPVIFMFGDLVYTGHLSALLLRPGHAIHTIVAKGLSNKAFSMPALLVLVPVVLVTTHATLVASPSTVLVAVVTCVLGLVGSTYLAAMAGALAFWMTKAQGVQGLLVGAEWILGGIIAPVALLPGPLAAIVPHQPLWFADAALPELLSGIRPASPLMPVEAAAWVVVLHLTYRLLWRRALRKYEAVGT